jgi:hypothetical protein
MHIFIVLFAGLQQYGANIAKEEAQQYLPYHLYLIVNRNNLLETLCEFTSCAADHKLSCQESLWIVFIYLTNIGFQRGSDIINQGLPILQ